MLKINVKNSYMSVIRVQRFKFNATMLWQLSANILKIYNYHFIVFQANDII